MAHQHLDQTRSIRAGLRPGQRRAALIIPLVVALGPALPVSAEQEASGEERDEQVDEMHRRFEMLSARYEREGRAGTAIEAIDDPLLRFSDPARESSDGSIWAWGRTGRPLALIALERHKNRWAYSLVSLRTQNSPRVSVTTVDGWKWSPEHPGLEFHEFAQTSTPSDEASRRLLQMKQLARRFALSETWKQERYTLRLLPRQVHRYANPDQGLVDGAFFVYAHGTNPEALLAIECRGVRRPSWKYAFASLADARVTARLGADPVWVKPRRRSPPRSQTPYTAFSIPLHNESERDD